MAEIHKIQLTEEQKATMQMMWDEEASFILKLSKAENTLNNMMNAREAWERSVCGGFTRTEVISKSGFDPLTGMTPEEIKEEAVKKLSAMMRGDPCNCPKCQANREAVKNPKLN